MTRFPVVLTLATAVAVVILLGLGTWQVQRLGWKRDLIARIEAAQTTTPVAWRPGIAEWTRVRLACDGFPDGRALYGLRDGKIVWRLATLCRAAGETVLVDRGLIDGASGAVSPPSPPPLRAASTVTGVVRPTERPLTNLAREAGWPLAATYVAVEAETPRAPGVEPAPLPPRLTNNHLGYAITWYGLAAALIGVYVALLRRRLKS